MSISAGLGTLLGSLIDYAGLFPPARLPLGEALANHFHYLGDPEGWMLGRFVCPASRLAELVCAHTALFAQGPRFGISALGRGGAESAEFLVNLEADRSDLRAFTGHIATAYVDVDVLEVRLPGDGLKNTGSLDTILTALADTQLQVFVEMPTLSEVRETLPGLLQRLKSASGFGFKLRTGGLEPSAFPSAQQIAHVLCSCIKANVPFKATAGLHHPLPRFDSVIGTRMHGFINLFVAGVLAFVGKAGEEEVQQILEDTEPSHFVFTSEGLRWRELGANTEEISQARREAVLSFGSCSFEEPRDDLRALGWL